MTPQENEQWLQDLDQQYRDLSDARIEEELERWRPDTEPRKILLGILEERRSAAQKPGSVAILSGRLLSILKMPSFRFLI
jgi:hypothetical protein